MIQFDCHAHVYETTRTVSGARYTPKAPAPLATWLKNLENHGLKGGVIIQVSFLGTDNSELCAALAKLDRSRFAGVAVVPLDVPDSELTHLVQSGVRGVRWNLVRGTAIPDLNASEVQGFFAKLRQYDLHLEVHLEGDRLAPHMDQLADQGVKLVIDHFGLPSEPNPKNDPFIQSVQALRDRRNLYLKLSAGYRTGFDVKPHWNILKEVLSTKQTLWGSDWPHTQHEDIVEYDKVFSEAIFSKGMCDAKSVEELYQLSVG